MPDEISWADRVVQVLRTWGRNAMVLQAPATNPSIVMKLKSGICSHVSGSNRISGYLEIFLWSGGITLTRIIV